jgi:hypothetical protein
MSTILTAFQIDNEASKEAVRQCDETFCCFEIPQCQNQWLSMYVRAYSPGRREKADDSTIMPVFVKMIQNLCLGFPFMLHIFHTTV